MESGSRQTLYLICGKIGAGKSTLARELRVATGELLISEDHWASNLFADDLKTIEDYGTSFGAASRGDGAACRRHPAARPFGGAGFSGQHREESRWMRSLIAQARGSPRAPSARPSRRRLQAAACRAKCGRSSTRSRSLTPSTISSRAFSCRLALMRALTSSFTRIEHAGSLPQCGNHDAARALSCRGGHHVCRIRAREPWAGAFRGVFLIGSIPDGRAADTARFGSEDTMRPFPQPCAQDNDRVIETSIPARLDDLRWSGFHTRVVLALGITWILDGLEVTLAGALSGALKESPTLRFSNLDVGFANSAYLAGAVLGALGFGWLTDGSGARNCSSSRLRSISRRPRPPRCRGVSEAMRCSGSSRARDRRRIHRDQFDDPGTGAGALPRLDRSGHQRQFLDRGGAWRHQRHRAARSRADRPDLGWRLAYLTGAGLGLVVFVMRMWIPESPRWLMIHGRPEQAHAIVDEIERSAKGHVVENEARERCRRSSCGCAAIPRCAKSRGRC